MLDFARSSTPIVIVSSVSRCEQISGIYVVDEEEGRQDGVDCYRMQGGVRSYTITRRDGFWWMDYNHGGTPYYCIESRDSLPPCGQWNGGLRCQASKTDVAFVNVYLPRGLAFNDVVAVQQRVFASRKFSDACIICCGERIPVHRAVLSAASDVFDAAFSSSMCEGIEASYEIKESSPVAVEAMLRYIYTGEIDVDVNELAALLELAVQYDLSNLVKQTAEALVQDGLTTENIKDRAQALKRHQGHPMTKDALERMCELIKRGDNNELVLALL